eukprot:3888916-Karenia_brevis.AAC.1
MGHVGPIPFLRANQVRAPSQLKYQETLRAFREFAKQNMLPLTSHVLMDKAVVEWMTYRYLEGGGPSSGSYLLAALQWESPALSRGGHKIL